MNRLFCGISLFVALCSAVSLSAHSCDSMVRPLFLREGDTVAVVSISSKLPKKVDRQFIRRLESWGLTVQLGEHLFCRDTGWFATTDCNRAADLQRAIDDPSVKAVLFCRGGYGAIRTLDYLCLDSLRRHPKWFVGFSDLTVMHYALLKRGIESIHGAMPLEFLSDTTVTDSSALSLREALWGRLESYWIPPHPLNRVGCARGRLVGGNLSLVEAVNGTDIDDPLETPSILFIEEVGESIYRIDRMLQTLLRSGKLNRVKAFVVGHFTRTMHEKEWGQQVYELIAAYADRLGVPVLFGFPAGHSYPNYSLYMGREILLSVTPEGGLLEFL